MSNNTLYQDFSYPLLKWFDCYGRKNLPWQHPRNAYRVWIAEIMLQQTQVQTVIPFFNHFMTSFPDLSYLAKASEEEVLAHWSGLGYYSRARNIHKTAQYIYEHEYGVFPSNPAKLVNLPGIGPSTAAAIASQAFNIKAAILDGNVKRVLSRYFTIAGNPEQSAVKKQLWQLAEDCMPHERCADYTQAIMDLGATCCTSRKPTCEECPLQKTCLAYINDQVIDYPTKKIKKLIPTREQFFLLLYNDNYQIYLEKNPPIGLWGGLWCMPSVETHENVALFIQQIHHLKSLVIEDLIEIKHTFSHFHLHIKALAIKTVPLVNQLSEQDGRWFSATELDNQQAFAKPTSDIIKFFFSSIQ